MSAANTISSILKHDDKRTTYKIPLIRALNDIVLSHVDLEPKWAGVAVPLRRIAERWIVYYRPFIDPDKPLLQGRRSRKRAGDALRYGLALLGVGGSDRQGD